MFFRKGVHDDGVVSMCDVWDGVFVCMHVYACVHSSMFARMGTVRCVSTYPLKRNMHVCVYVYTHP